ncbi:MAG: DUF4399 domain-containing protein [Xanthomonadales bacterium]|nr:DUF4399 domain-containing protein [Xanthomonadales bacterium]
MNRPARLLALCVLAGLLPAGAFAADNARVYIISPVDGATVFRPFTVQFGLSGMGVAPAGVARENTGHHHLLIDLDELPPQDQPLPANEHVIHFGGGQTEVTLDLLPGKHTLQLILGDHAHVPHDPPVISERITIHVSE